ADVNVYFLTPAKEAWRLGANPPPKHCCITTSMAEPRKPSSWLAYAVSHTVVPSEVTTKLSTPAGLILGLPAPRKVGCARASPQPQPSTSRASNGHLLPVRNLGFCSREPTTPRDLPHRRRLERVKPPTSKVPEARRTRLPGSGVGAGGTIAWKFGAMTFFG